MVHVATHGGVGNTIGLTSPAGMRMMPYSHTQACAALESRPARGQRRPLGRAGLATLALRKLNRQPSQELHTHACTLAGFARRATLFSLRDASRRHALFVHRLHAAAWSWVWLLRTIHRPCPATTVEGKHYRQH